MIKHTKSYCNICLKEIPASVVKKNNKIKIKKTCKKHGVMESDYMWSNPQDYYFFQSLGKLNPDPKGVMIPLTSKCNLFCPICFAKSSNESNKEDIKLDELKRIDVTDFNLVKLTGGEPTLRKDLHRIIEFFKKQNKWVGLYSNGIKLADKEYVAKLKKAGLEEVTLQFDTFNETTSKFMRGEPLTDQKLKALSNLKKNNIKTGLFVVLLNNVNTNELANFKKLIKDFNIKSVELTSQMGIGRYVKNKNIEVSEIFEAIEKNLGLQKKDFYSTTKFLFDTSKLFKLKHLNKCSLANMFLINNSNLISLNKIFNLEKINEEIKIIKQKKYSSFIWPIFILSKLTRRLFFNYFVNKNYRIFLQQLLKNVLKYSFKNKALINPFITIMVNGPMSLENIDLEIVSDCHKRIYSKKSGFQYTTCSYYIKGDS